jgi:2-iminobutanoate/2-iminopropanoate deaminase
MSDAQAGDVGKQTRRSLERLAEILLAAGSELARVLKMTVYVASIEHWDVVNAVCTEMLGAHRPARAVVPVCPLHFGALVEIDAIAIV